jgi:hypothetical protein
MAELTLVNGLIIKCMVKPFINGKMVENMMVITHMIKNKGLENIIGPMVDVFKANG